MTDEQDLNQYARQILKANDRGSYTVPTHGLYPYQWNWDSAFAALGFATFDTARAWDELDTLMSGQWVSGMVPHILFHQSDPGYFPGPDVWGGIGPVPSSGISQPPIAATMARLIWQRDPAVARDRMASLYPALLAWHRWFMTWRLDKGAVCITHPWEAGRDNAPDWDGAMARIDPAGVGEYKRRDTSHVDPAMRPTKYDYDRYIWLVQLGRRLNWDDAALLAENPFRVADPTMHFTLLRAMRDLEAMGNDLGMDTSEIPGWIKTLEDGAQTLWNPEIGCYDARDAVDDTFAGCVSNASFLCWFGGLESPEMIAQYDRVMASCAYGVPSHDPASEKFDAKRYWRGPVWGVMNTLIGIGLSDMGHLQGEALRLQTQELIREKGFAEYFDPLTGDPAGGSSFTWTAAIWLAWAGRED